MARIITKGLIGAQDINFGNGTFSRATSTGGTQTLNQVSGMAQSAGSDDQVTQGANIGSKNLVASAAVGFYVAKGYAVVTRVATTSSTLPSIVVAWTDADSGQAMTFTLTPQDSSNVLTALQSGLLLLNVKAATAISYSTTGFASVGATSMQYSVHLRVEGPS